MTMKEAAGRPVRKIGYVYGILASFAYCTQAPMTKVLLGLGFTSYDITALLFLFSTVIINAYVLASGKKEVYREGREHPFVFLSMGLLYFAAYLLFFIAMNYLNAGIGTVLFYLSPVMICLFFLITKIKPVSNANKIAVLLALFGCSLALNLFSKGATQGVTTIGILFGVSAAACSAGGNLVADLKGHGLSSLSMILFNTTVGGVAALLIKPKVLLLVFSLTPFYLMVFFLIGLLTKVLPAWLFYEELKCIGSERASVVSTIETPLSLLVSYLLLHETLLPVQMAGVAVIIGAILLLQAKS